MLKAIAISLALLMSISGSGAYYVHYCCHKCQEQGVLGILEDRCNEVHKCHSCSTDRLALSTKTAEFHFHDHDRSCTMKHIVFDLENITHEQLSASALVSSIVSAILPHEPSSYTRCLASPTSPFHYSGRDYLALYSTLLI